MYLTKDINIDDLSQVKIRRQAEIVQKTGDRLEPKAAFQLLKEESANFERETELLLKIDEKMAVLFEREGILNAASPSDEEDEKERERYRIRAMAEMEELELLNLQLQLKLDQNHQSQK